MDKKRLVYVRPTLERRGINSIKSNVLLCSFHCVCVQFSFLSKKHERLMAFGCGFHNPHTCIQSFVDFIYNSKPAPCIMKGGGEEDQCQGRGKIQDKISRATKQQTERRESATNLYQIAFQLHWFSCCCCFRSLLCYKSPLFASSYFL